MALKLCKRIECRWVVETNECPRKLGRVSSVRLGWKLKCPIIGARIHRVTASRRCGGAELRGDQELDQILPHLTAEKFWLQTLQGS